MPTLNSSVLRYDVSSARFSVIDPAWSEREVALPTTTLPRHLYCNLLVEAKGLTLKQLGNFVSEAPELLIKVGSEWYALKSFMLQFIGFEADRMRIRSRGKDASELCERLPAIVAMLAKHNFDSDGYLND